MEPTTEDLSVFNAEESPIRYLSEDEEEVSTKDSSEEEERPAKNVVTGKDFAKLTKKARKLCAESLDYSPRKNNQYVATLPDGKKGHFGSPKYPDFLIHQNDVRKERYLARAKKIKNEQGELTFDKPESANYWST